MTGINKEYVPRTAIVRGYYATAAAFGGDVVDSALQFNRWLTAHDAKIRAAALEEATSLPPQVPLHDTCATSHAPQGLKPLHASNGGTDVPQEGLQMSEPEFALTPPKWMTAAVEDIVRSLNNPFGIDPDNMINNYTRTERKPSWLARRKQFAKDWKRMQKLGLKNEFLDRGHCYECGGELEITTNTTYLVGTPNPDYIPPAPIVGNSIIIPRAQKGSK